MAGIESLVAGAAFMVPSALLQGVVAWGQQKQLSKEQKAEAAQLKINIEAIQKEIDANKIDMTEAMGRIDTLIDTLGGSLRTAMEAQLDTTVVNLQGQLSDAIAASERQLEKARGTLTEEQEKIRQAQADQLKEMRQSLESSREQIRQQMVQRRLGGSEAAQAAGRKSEEVETQATTKMQKQAGETEAEFAKRIAQMESEAGFQRGQLTSETQRQIAAARTGGAANIAQALTGLGLQGEAMKQPLAAEQRAFRTSGMQNIWSLQNLASGLSEAAKRSPWTAGLSGLASGLGGGMAQIGGALMGQAGAGGKTVQPAAATPAAGGMSQEEQENLVNWFRF